MARVFAQALAVPDTFRSGSFPAWLFAIAHNACANAVHCRPDLPLAA